MLSGHISRGAKVVLFPHRVEIGRGSLENIRTEDSQTIMRVGMLFLDSEGNELDYREECPELNIRTKQSKLPNTDYMSDEMKAWFVAELCGEHETTTEEILNEV